MDEATGYTQDRDFLPAGKVLWKEGEKRDAAYLVETGAVGFYRGDTLIGIVEAGTMIGCAAVLLECPQPFTAKGHTDAKNVTLLKKYDGHNLRHQFTSDASLVPEVHKGLDAEIRVLRIHLATQESDPAHRARAVRSLLRARAQELPDLLAGRLPQPDDK